MPLNDLLDELDQLSLLHIKKLLIKRREHLQQYTLSNYQLSIAKQTIQIKNQLFLRQMRTPHALHQFVPLEQNLLTQNQFYTYNDQNYILLERKDDYTQYQPEFILTAAANSNVFTGFDFSFYGSSKSFFLVNSATSLHDLIQYLQKIVDGNYVYKNAINHVLYLVFQLLKIFKVLHEAQITLSGDFGAFVIKNDVLKVNLASCQIAVPEKFNSGVVQDYAAFKELLVNCLPVFIKTRDQTVSDGLNDVFGVINQIISGVFQESCVFYYMQNQLHLIASKLMLFPIFEHPLYPHFLSRDITAEVIYQTIIEPIAMPEIIKLEQKEKYELEQLQNSINIQEETRHNLRAKSAHNAIRYYGKMQAAFTYQQKQVVQPITKFEHVLGIEKQKERTNWTGEVKEYDNLACDDESTKFNKITIATQGNQIKEVNQAQNRYPVQNKLQNTSRQIKQTYIVGDNSEMLMNAFSLETGFIGQRTTLFQCTQYNTETRNAKITENLRSASVRKPIELENVVSNLYKVVPLLDDNQRVQNQIKQINFTLETNIEKNKKTENLDNSKQEIKEIIKNLMQ